MDRVLHIALFMPRLLARPLIDCSVARIKPLLCAWIAPTIIRPLRVIGEMLKKRDAEQLKLTLKVLKSLG